MARMKDLAVALEELEVIMNQDSSATNWFKLEQIRYEFGFKTRTAVIEYFNAWLNEKAGA